MLRVAVALAAAAGSLAGWPAGSRADASAAPYVPPGLPAHLGLGLTAGPEDVAAGGWMPSSGVPWDYAYTYIAGGVNTSSGWQTWNANGTYPIDYAQSAAADGYIPVFPYYELLQSSGACSSCGEAQRDLTHLNDPTLMASYYADFATLMKRLGPGTYDGVAGFGGKTIVQVEPDLSGYMEQAALDTGSCYGYCTGQGNDPSLVKAEVASSGDPDVAGFPDTYRGFSLALAHLRDLYAPNVVLAFHVSDWATRVDIGSDTNASTDATDLGDEAGAFAAAAGAERGRYDLVFNDVADRDSQVSGVWWDRTNSTLPNFHRWEQYVSAITATTGLAAVVWQVPEGNQYFDTEDGSAGHTQDNRAEYFLNHPQELVAAGVVAVLFGRGNGGSTTHTDAQADGVTNPPSTCTGAGMGGGTICNDHVSTVADDDGGYLRMQGGAYYRSPVPLAAPAPAANPGGGYWVASPAGRVSAFGDAPYYGGLGAPPAAPVVAVAATPDRGGYWMAGADGGVFSFGDAAFHGSAGNLHLAAPVVGLAATADGAGYWLVASDGGIFTYGDARFFGSTGASRLNQPIVGMAPTPSGRGYWLVARDGGVFSFGDARFFGSTGAIRLNRPVVGLAATAGGGGYWLVASDGGVFTFGDAGFHGSGGNLRLAAPVVGMAATPDGAGYWMAGADGGVLTFGDAGFFGSAAGSGPAAGLAVS